MSYRRRTKSSGWFLRLILCVAIGYGIYSGGRFLWQRKTTFNAEEILSQSVLQEKNFAHRPIEVVSPKYKIKAYLLEEKSNPIISLSFMFKGSGYAADDENKQGISNMVAAMLTEGTADLDSQAFKEVLENKAIGISFSASVDDFSGALVTTSKNKQEAFKLLQDIFVQPRFATEDLSRIKNQMQKALLLQKEHPQSKLRLATLQYVYGPHAYGRNPLGRAEDIAALSRKDLQQYMQTHMAQNNLLVGAAGDITPDELETVLDEVFGALPQTSALNFVRKAKPDFDRGEKNIDYPAAGQNISAFAAQGVARTAADFYPLYIANHIFGGSGLSSRLSKAAREEKGLTYSIYSYLSLADNSPLIQGGFSSTPDKFAEVKNIFAQEWNKFGKYGASKEEIAEAKNYLISSYNLRFSSISNLSDILLYMQKDNLGLDFLQERNNNIKKVSDKEINDAAAKYYQADKYILVNIGNFAQN